jgi:chromosomal replication initiation ATPase DnaA
LERDDVSYRRDLRSSVEAEDIMAVVSKHFGVPIDDLLGVRGVLRNMTVYLIKKHTEMTNRQIGELFGRVSYSAISQVKKRFSQKARKDKFLQNELEKLEKKILHVKG